MKFQNPIIKFIWMDGQAQPICPFNFSKVVGIIVVPLQVLKKNIWLIDKGEF